MLISGNTLTKTFCKQKKSCDTSYLILSSIETNSKNIIPRVTMPTKSIHIWMCGSGMDRSLNPSSFTWYSFWWVFTVGDSFFTVWFLCQTNLWYPIMVSPKADMPLVLPVLYVCLCVRLYHHKPCIEMHKVVSFTFRLAYSAQPLVHWTERSQSMNECRHVYVINKCVFWIIFSVSVFLHALL
jgi:hypothetical protein